MDSIDFAAFLNEKLKTKGMSLKKLADSSGIPIKHIQNLSEGRYQDLPPAPYLRGYIASLGSILNFDGTAAWEHLRQLPTLKGSGNEDALPQNRFATQSNRPYAIAGVVALLIVGYLGFRFSEIFGRPVLRVEYPKDTITSVTDPHITLQGTLENGDTVSINGEAVTPSTEGTWEKRLLLEPGLNTIEISAKKFLGREVRILRQVLYEQTPAPAQAVSGSATTSAPQGILPESTGVSGESGTLP